jgi:hypothetical protein
MRAKATVELYEARTIATFAWHLLNDAQAKREIGAPRGEGK